MLSKFSNIYMYILTAFSCICPDVMPSSMCLLYLCSHHHHLVSAQQHSLHVTVLPTDPASLLIIIIIYNLHCTHKPFNQHCQKLSFFQQFCINFADIYSRNCIKRDRRAFTELIHVKIILHNKFMTLDKMRMFVILYFGNLFSCWREHLDNLDTNFVTRFNQWRCQSFQMFTNRKYLQKIFLRTRDLNR